MAEWQKEWQNGRMVGMATYVLFMVHTDDTNTTIIFYSIDISCINHLTKSFLSSFSIFFLLYQFLNNIII